MSDVTDADLDEIALGESADMIRTPDRISMLAFDMAQEIRRRRAADLADDSERWRVLLATSAVEVNAMRLARAEDHRACARLAARVRELEAEVECMRASRNQLSRQLNGVTVERVITIAEGTRDERAELRCVTCRVPLPPPWATTCEACSR